MSGILKKPVDFEALENELDEAVRADELYKLQNDAKIRAIEQKVPTYDHFRNMVLTAHLKPLERSELRKRAQVSWNRACDSNDIDSDDYDDVEVDGSCDELIFISRSEEVEEEETEFRDAWDSSADASQKLRLLVQHKYDLKDKIFADELPSDFLGDMLKICLDTCSADTITDVLDVLRALSECNRFAQSLATLSTTDKSNVKPLFDKLLLSARDRAEMSRVKGLILEYCIEKPEKI